MTCSGIIRGGSISACMSFHETVIGAKVAAHTDIVARCSGMKKQECWMCLYSPESGEYT